MSLLRFSTIDSMRRSYARAEARKIVRDLLTVQDPEYWLACKIEEALKTYEAGLEKVAGHYEKLAQDAWAARAADPILVVPAK